MSSQSARPLNPVPDEFAGDSFGRALKRAFHATRPKFYPASVLPVVTGTAWGAYAAESFSTYVFLLALVATVCVHAAANVLNDVGDEMIGTDGRNEERIYPYTGGSRFIQTGILSQSRMARLGVALLCIALLAGVLLYLARGPIVLAFGLIGVALAIFYSLGPVRLASLGLGETAVAIAFGVLPVTGAAWLQGAEIDSSLVLYSLPVSAWVAAILLINEVPDMEADGACGKNTLPVRLGRRVTSLMYLILHVGAVAFVTALVLLGRLPPLAPAVPIGLLALSWKAAGGIRTGLDDRAGMTKSIEATLAVHTVGCIWLSACSLYALWF